MNREPSSPRPVAGLIAALALVSTALALYPLVFQADKGGEGLDSRSLLGAVLGLAILALSLRQFLAPKAIASGKASASLSPMPAPMEPAAPPKPSQSAVEPGTEALLLLSMLQEKGRFVDFAMEDIAAFTNDQVGAAARVVHQGCRQVILEVFSPVPVAPAENARMILETGYDAEEFRLMGRMEGKPPFDVKVTHKGWRAKQVKLPRRLKAGSAVGNPVIVPAEVTA